MTAPLRGTQSVVGQMGWVFDRPLLVVLELAWRWIFGIPFLFVCWMRAQQLLVEIPPESAGLNSIDAQNPWIAARQIGHVWEVYAPHLASELRWLAPIAALAWIAISGIGRSLVLSRLDPVLKRNRVRIAPMIAMQTAWFAILLVIFGGWFLAMHHAAVSHVYNGGEPDLIGLAAWSIFLSLGFFTAWALLSWPFAMAPLLLHLEGCGPLQAFARSLYLGRAFTGKLIEINLVMGIVNLALIVLAMVLSAAPLPFSDELGPQTMHLISLGSAVFYLVASDYFQLVRLKGFVEFWKMFRGDANSV